MYVSMNGKNNADWMIDFLGKTISQPVPKTNYVDIPFRDGKIDLTESLSPVIRYYNRVITMRFEIRLPRIEWAQFMLEFSNEYHGNNVEIVFDDDSSHYWRGRATVGELEDHGSTAGITVTVDAEPFRYTIEPLYHGTLTVPQTGSLDWTFECESLRGIPKFQIVSMTAGEMSVLNNIIVRVPRNAINSQARALTMNKGSNHWVVICNGGCQLDLVITGGDL